MEESSSLIRVADAESIELSVIRPIAAFPRSPPLGPTGPMSASPRSPSAGPMAVPPRSPSLGPTGVSPRSPSIDPTGVSPRSPPMRRRSLFSLNAREREVSLSSRAAPLGGSSAAAADGNLEAVVHNLLFSTKDRRANGWFLFADVFFFFCTVFCFFLLLLFCSAAYLTATTTTATATATAWRYSTATVTQRERGSRGGETKRGGGGRRRSGGRDMISRQRSGKKEDGEGERRKYTSSVGWNLL